MPKQLLVNLAVDDLDRSIEFFRRLGFEFDPRFTDETATCMVVGEDAYVMLLSRERFGEFTIKPYAEPSWQTQAILAVAAESREAVDRLANMALAVGAAPVGGPQELDLMYARSFLDPDGHHWEVFWMDPRAVEEKIPAAAAP